MVELFQAITKCSDTNECIRFLSASNWNLNVRGIDSMGHKTIVFYVSQIYGYKILIGLPTSFIQAAVVEWQKHNGSRTVFNEYVMFPLSTISKLHVM